MARAAALRPLMRLPSLVSVFICLVSSLARAQSGDFEIAEINAKAGTFTGKLHGQMRSIRVRQDVEVTINGLKAAFEELEPRMKVRVTSGATVHGTVNAETVSTTTSFDYGLTTGYGAGTPSLVTGTTATAISATRTGLSPRYDLPLPHQRRERRRNRNGQRPHLHHRCKCLGDF